MGERCGVVVASCVCELSSEEHAIHVCACGGSWSGEVDEFRVWDWPDPLGLTIHELFGGPPSPESIPSPKERVDGA